MTMMTMTMINGSNQNFLTKRTSTRTRNRTLFFAVVLLLLSSSSLFTAAQETNSFSAPENETVGTCVPNGAFCGNYSVARMIENQNTALGNYGTCGGGERNTAGSHTCYAEEEEVVVPILVDYTVIGGGSTNLNAGTKATISGGMKNRIHHNLTNSVEAVDPTVANQYSVISGGHQHNQYEGTEFEYATTGSVITGGVENFWEGT